MSDLNRYIETTNQFTAPASMDKLPGIDRTEQVNYALEIARRAAERQPETPMPPMEPIVPVAN